MAASGFTPISLYYSTTASAVPTSGNLANGELGLNIADMKLYAKNSAGTVTLLASNAASATSGTSILYGNGSGGFSNVTIGSGVSFAGGTLSATGSGGSVTSVSGTGTVNGLTLTGTVTTSGSLTLGGTLSLVSPPPIGSTTPNTGAFTTLSATGLSSLVATNINAGGDASILNIGNTAIPNNNLRSGWNNSSGYGYVRTVGTWTLYLGSNSTNIAAIAETGLTLATNSNTTASLILGGLNATNGVLQFASSGTAYQILGGDYQGNLNLYTGVGGGPIVLTVGNTERFRVASAGQIGLTGANYGTAGEVLTSGGASAAPTWATAGGGGTTMLFCAFSSTMGL